MHYSVFPITTVLYQAEAQKEATMDAMVAAFQRRVADTIMGATANAQRSDLTKTYVVCKPSGIPRLEIRWN